MQSPIRALLYGIAIWFVWVSLIAASAQILPSGISGPEISHALADCRCTIMVGVPRLYEAMLNAIESRVHGRGAAIRGGRGSFAGTLLGVVLLGAIGPALTFLGVSAYWERALQGAIIS